MAEKPFVETAGRSIQLFNGVNLDGWRQAGPGGFRIDNRMLVTEGGLGLLWYSTRQFGNFELRVDWKVTKKSDNSGVFVRFPRRPLLMNQAAIHGSPSIRDTKYKSTMRERRTAKCFTRQAPSMACNHRRSSLPGRRASRTLL